MEPKSPFHPEHFGQLRFAHRGGYAFGPENTLEAIVKNIRERNINALEIDVQITQDGELILFHDDSISRILASDDDRKVSDLTASEILSLPLRDTSLGTVHTPLFADVVDALASIILLEGKRFMIEVDFKPHASDTERAVSSLVQIIESREEMLGDVIYEYFFVSSFYPGVLSEIRGRSDKIVMGQGVNSDPANNVLAARAVISAAHFLMKMNDVRILEPNHCLVTEDFVNTWTARGVLINAYTVNTACEKAYINIFPIAYTTNCPDEICIHDASDQLSTRRNWCTRCDAGGAHTR